MSAIPSPQDIHQLIEAIVNSYHIHPLDLENKKAGDGEYKYLSALKSTYERTVCDIVSACGDKAPATVNVLEIGAFLGVVSFALSKLGFSVKATDIPEYTSTRVKVRFAENGVDLVSGNLRDYFLPFADSNFDVVIMCETLEHLNFNPLPVIKEINRVMKRGAFLYVTVPNLVALPNRLKLWQGKSIHNPIKQFFDQLHPKGYMTVGLHWREYTGVEIKEMLERIGFVIRKQDCEFNLSTQPQTVNKLKRTIKHWVHWFLNRSLIKRVILGCFFDPANPDVGDILVTLCQKERDCDIQFYFTATTSPPK